MNTAVDISVEFSHIYSDEIPGQEHIMGIQYAQEELVRFKTGGKRVLSLVLLDDIHIKGRSRSADEIKAEMEQFGAEVDVIVRESEMLSGVLIFLRNLRRSQIKIESFDRDKRHVVFLDVGVERVSLGSIKDGTFTPTCALLASVWHVARLGEIKIRGIPSASNTLTILQERYHDVERKALAIIKASRYAGSEKRIEHVFLKRCK